MNEPRFKIGQEVVCIYDNWYDMSTREKCSGPKKNEIYTVTYVCKFPIIPGYGVCLEGFGDECFYEKYFEPVIRIDDLKAILEQQPEEVTI